MSTVALLGTRYTMEREFYRRRLERHGLTVVVVAGCTEIELLVGPDDVEVAYFPTTRLHALAAVDRALADE